MIPETEHKKNYEFPKGFLWGAATSAHQVEGNNINNDWWVAEQQGFIPFKSGKAADHYVRFEEDFDIAKKLRHNTHRFSIEWSRIEPEPGQWDQAEIGHYRLVLQALRQRGLKSFVTLHHFTNPVWLAGGEGWRNPKTPSLFGRYAGKIAETLGDLIDFYIPINEPLVYIGVGYREGRWPPFEKDSYLKALAVFRAMINGHRQAYQAIKAVQSDARIGIAANLIDVQPRHRWNPLDQLVSATYDYVWNWAFLNRIAKQLDFIGVNYYFHHHVHTAPFGAEKRRGHELSDIGWGIHPEGLYYVLKSAARYKKPIYITENGLADETDAKRTGFILDHLSHLAKAMQEGADVRGYLHWSLIDNFEWEKGFAPRFGLVEVDYKTMERKVRPSAKVYAEICRNNKLLL